MISIHGKMLVKSLRDTILETYGLRLKVHQGFSMGQTAEDSATVASARSDKAQDFNGSIELQGSMTVAQAEESIKSKLGFAVQILDSTGANADNNSLLTTLGFRIETPAVAAAVKVGGSKSDISVTGQKKLSTIQTEFTGKFLQLGLMFFSLDEAAKAEQGLNIRPLPSDQTIASVRTKTAQGDMSIHGNTTVGSLEGRFKSDYGLYVQVCVMRDGKPTYTGSNLDGTTLSDLDRRAAEKGREVFQYAAQ